MSIQMLYGFGYLTYAAGSNLGLSSYQIALHRSELLSSVHTSCKNHIKLADIFCVNSIYLYCDIIELCSTGDGSRYRPVSIILES